MLVFATLLSVLSAEPTAVMVQSRSGMAAEELKKALTTIDAELSHVAGLWTLDETQKRLKAVGLSDGVACAGKMPCLLDLATKVKARWLVTVSVSKIGRDRAWALAAVESASGTQLAVEEWLDESNGDIGAPVSSFVKRLAPLVAVKDAPVAVTLDPTPPPPPPEPVPAVVAQASRPLPKVLLISGAVVAAVAVGLAVGASVTAAPLNQVTTTPDGQRLSSLSQTEATQRASNANALTGAAIAAGVVAAGLGVGAVVTW